MCFLVRGEEKIWYSIFEKCEQFFHVLHTSYPAALAKCAFKKSQKCITNTTTYCKWLVALAGSLGHINHPAELGEKTFITRSHIMVICVIHTYKRNIPQWMESIFILSYLHHKQWFAFLHKSILSRTHWDSQMFQIPFENMVFLLVWYVVFFW